MKALVSANFFISCHNGFTMLLMAVSVTQSSYFMPLNASNTNPAATVENNQIHFNPRNKLFF